MKFKAKCRVSSKIHLVLMKSECRVCVQSLRGPRCAVRVHSVRVSNKACCEKVLFPS